MFTNVVQTGVIRRHRNMSAVLCCILLFLLLRLDSLALYGNMYELQLSSFCLCVCLARVQPEEQVA